MIRPALPEDVGAMVQIYNQSIDDRVHANLDSRQPDCRKFESLYFPGSSPPIVLVSENAGHITGWGALKPFSALPATSEIAEVAVYIERGHRNRGTGIFLLKALTAAAAAAGLHSLVAIILGHNRNSLRGARACGFSTAVTLESVAEIYDEPEDVVWMQRVLGSNSMGHYDER